MNQSVPGLRDLDDRPTLLGACLDAPEVAGFVRELDAQRLTGRRGYGARAMIGVALIRGIYGYRAWSQATKLIGEHPVLQEILGCTPSRWAAYRFAARLLRDGSPLQNYLAAVLESLKTEMPGLGVDVAIDATDITAWSNGQKYVYSGGPERKRFSDPDATWGHKSATGTAGSRGFFGYKWHQIVCAKWQVPVAWGLTTAKTHETLMFTPMLRKARDAGFATGTIVGDLGYDSGDNYSDCDELECIPIIPIREGSKSSAAVAEMPPICIHGEWTYGGTDYGRRQTKWRCPEGKCSPANVWRRNSRNCPLVPRDGRKWRRLFLAGRHASETENAILKERFAVQRPVVRGLNRVSLFLDLVELARLSVELARARARSAAQLSRAA
jgi:hypothetical protein